MKRLIFLIMIIFLVGCNNNESSNNNETNIDNEDINKTETIDSNIGKNNDQINDDSNSLSKDDSEDKENSEEINAVENEKEIEIDYETIKPNEIGDIIVVMYHGIMDNPPYHRTAENFRKDLQYMYDHGYRLISMEDYINNNINIEPGKTPIVLTFDDGLSSTFSLEEVNGELVPKKETAIAIIEEFAKEHPDFGKAAILYIFTNNPFDGAGTYEERLQWLVDNGYEIGNHVYGHPKLSQLGGDKIQENIGIINNSVYNAINYNITSLAYPFGIMPKDEYVHLIEKGEYDGITYNNILAFREAVRNPMVPPIHKDFEPLNVSRARGSEGEYGDLWHFFEYYEKHPEEKYISDGNPNRISVPKELVEYVNEEKLDKLELYTY